MDNLKNTENEYYEILDAVTQKKNKLTEFTSPYNVNEKKILEGLDNIANKVKQYKHNSEGFYNLTLLEILTNTSSTLLNIINEISALLDEQKKNEINDNWWSNYTNKIKEILLIITLKDRLIYLGIFLIFLSIVVYFIEISS